MAVEPSDEYQDRMFMENRTSALVRQTAYDTKKYDMMIPIRTIRSIWYREVKIFSEVSAPLEVN